MSELREVWVFWYDAQEREQQYNSNKYSVGEPSLRPASPFDPEEDAQELRRAMKGLGTNEETIINILSTRTLNQRIKIQDKYQQVHGRDLVEDLKSELTGIFEKVILSLLKPLPLFLAEQIKSSTKGMGTDENALIEIFCTRDDESVKTIKEAFEKEFDTSLEKIICKETTGNFEKILMSILSFCKDDDSDSPSDVAEQLSKDDVNEDAIRIALTSHSFEFLKNVFEAYKESTGEDFLQLIEGERCSSEAKQALKAIYSSSQSRIEYFANALNDAMQGLGSDEWALIRIIVSRCEIDLQSIKRKYNQLFEKDLVEQVKNELSGDYEKVLLNLLGD